MPRKVGAVSEAFPAIGAFVGSLSRMEPLMCNEGRPPIKASPTVGALAGFLPREDSLLDGAGCAGVGAFPILVHRLMSQKM